MEYRSPKRIARALAVRRYNCITPPPAYYAPARVLHSQDVRTRTVGKSGEVRISEFPQGADVTVVRASDQVFIVSSLPAHEVKAIASALPSTKESPYEALSSLLEGRPRGGAAKRVRHPYSEPIAVAEIGDDEALASEFTGPRRAPR